jgi:hypothetical protein
MSVLTTCLKVSIEILFRHPLLIVYYRPRKWYHCESGVALNRITTIVAESRCVHPAVEEIVT